MTNTEPASSRVWSSAWDRFRIRKRSAFSPRLTRSVSRRPIKSGRIHAATELRNAVQLGCQAGRLQGMGRSESKIERPNAASGLGWSAFTLSTGTTAALPFSSKATASYFCAHTPAELNRMRGVDFDSESVDHDAYPPTNEIDTFDIEYDPVAKIFVGTKDDELVVPVPGEVRRRRSAVAVVAERIVDLIDEQSKAEKGHGKRRNFRPGQAPRGARKANPRPLAMRGSASVPWGSASPSAWLCGPTPWRSPAGRRAERSEARRTVGCTALLGRRFRGPRSRAPPGDPAAPQAATARPWPSG